MNPRVIYIYLIIICLAVSIVIGQETDTSRFPSVEELAKGEPLKGKKICLDPGHGGEATGAVGVKGLAEKDVNLKEALMLKDMLEKAGAKVCMTRTDDSAVGIRERAEFNKEQDSDLFVSIHHNANAQADRTVNRIEVFYHWKDRGGPSQDAANHVYRQMQALLGLPDSKVYMCWAYGVLRENKFPAILVEPSYLANPEEEERLRDEKYLRAIAEAYFRGILKFFEGGRPEIELDEEIDPGKKGVIEARIIRPDGSALIDPQAVNVRIDGDYHDDFTYDYDSGKLSIRLPASLDEGKHELELSARNLAWHTSEVERREFSVPKKMKPPVTKRPVMFGGVLVGKNIVVDPEGGGDDPCVIGETGLRASDINLRTGLYLYDYLRRAGADVAITRRIDKSMDNVARVRFGLDRDPDVFVSVGHRLPEAGMNEKTKMLVSRIGSRWSGGRNVGKEMIYHLRHLLGTGAALGDPMDREPHEGEVHNWSSWEVMHAAQNYSAMYVSPMMFDAPGVEERLTRTAATRKEAMAIAYGLADFFGADERKLGTIKGTVVCASSGKTLDDVLVFLDDNLIAQTEPDGKFVLEFLLPGKHTLEFRKLGRKDSSEKIKIEGEEIHELTVKMNLEK